MPQNQDMYIETHQECATVWSIELNGARDDLQIEQHVHVPEILRDGNSSWQCSSLQYTQSLSSRLSQGFNGCFAIDGTREVTWSYPLGSCCLCKASAKECLVGQCRCHVELMKSAKCVSGSVLIVRVLRVASRYICSFYAPLRGRAEALAGTLPCTCSKLQDTALPFSHHWGPSTGVSLAWWTVYQVL